ncbi:hypothetical protein IQ289_31560 [Burkholderia sp. R-70006]|uniref:DUF6884 domain-containing protein n=1 Tax=Paraburkholderia domus TaxID=2793075 RepID=UPI0019138B83|nr:DUF6884 domain-containing protein [Paraburkholderia domus]MBK5052923.1 hypothetical protein [Burkholderia sp. R-70006]
MPAVCTSSGSTAAAGATRRPVLLMACSAAKLDRAAPAIELYRGVMFGSYSAHVRRQAQPVVLILSALHGFVAADTLLEPYEQKMSRDRAEEMLAQLPRYMSDVIWPTDAREVFLAGGMQYRRVMRAAIARLMTDGKMDASLPIAETSGGIGFQRSQLGRYLRELRPSDPNVIGHHANGTPLFASAGGFGVNQRVTLAYRSRPDLPSQIAIIEQLFNGPCGLTASVVIERSGRGATQSGGWVDLRDLRPL